MKDKKHKRWCSKHQVVHGEFNIYWSCSLPNDKETHKKLLDNRRKYREQEKKYQKWEQESQEKA